jgi:hypothetical protein
VPERLERELLERVQEQAVYLLEQVLPEPV